MEDLKSLERFLRTEEEKSHRSQLGKMICKFGRFVFIPIKFLPFQFNKVPDLCVFYFMKPLTMDGCVNARTLF